MAVLEGMCGGLAGLSSQVRSRSAMVGRVKIHDIVGTGRGSKNELATTTCLLTQLRKFITQLRSSWP